MVAEGEWVDDKKEEKSALLISFTSYMFIDGKKEGALWVGSHSTLKPTRKLGPASRAFTTWPGISGHYLPTYAVGKGQHAMIIAAKY